MAQQTSPPTALKELRVGIISYDNPEKKVRAYQALFTELGPELSKLQIGQNPNFAVGGYADVLDWISRGLVDIAVLSPCAFAETQEARTPRAKASSARAVLADENTPDCIYIASEGKPPADNQSWVNDKLKWSNLPDRCRFAYNSFCLVPVNSTIKTFPELKEAARRKQVQFVFGDPLSASSAILPMHVLHSHDIDFREHMEYTFGHEDSMRLLFNEPVLRTPNGKETLERVAFVYDGAFKPENPLPEENQSNFRRIEIPLVGKDLNPKEGKSTMNDILLPIEVWVARKDYDSPDRRVVKELQRILRTHRARNTEGKVSGQPRELVKGPQGQELADFYNHEDCPESNCLESRFKDLREWAQEARSYITEEDQNSNTAKTMNPDISGMRFPIRFGDIINLVRHYDFIHRDDRKRARLALVLAGGGAKCAYEAGAVTEFERQLQAMREGATSAGAGTTSAVDIDLVVGTSGGALNAVPIAAGITQRALATMQPLHGTWRSLNAFDILRPPMSVQIAWGICCAFFYFIIVRWFVLFLRWLRPSTLPRTWVRLSVALLILVPLGLLIVFSFPFLLKPILLLGWKWLFYPVFALGFGIFFWAPISICWAVVILANEHRLTGSADKSTSKSRKSVTLFREILSWARPEGHVPLWLLLSLGISLIVLAVIFAFQNPEGLFKGEPLVDAVTKCYAELFEPVTKPNLQSQTLANRRKTMSKIIYDQIRNGNRDLVVTGSSLTENLRGTKYFYVQAGHRRNACDPPSYGARGIEIGPVCDPQNLVDVAIGSGTIFPIFPSHEIEAPPQSKSSMQSTINLIDGGFAHNTPIEAAVLWGATHIILIEVSPEAPVRGDVHATFWGNAWTAFDYLYSQAQLADVNAQEEAAVFMLRPQLRTNGPSIGLLDFGVRFAEYELKYGSEDALGRRFVRQPAAPHFWPTQALK